MQRRGEGNSDQRGAALVVMALMLVGVMVMAVVLAGVGERTMRRARAQSAADAAALAGAVDGVDGARSLARANDADLVRFSDQGSTIWVVVDRGGVRAQARAEQRLEISP